MAEDVTVLKTRHYNIRPITTSLNRLCVILLDRIMIFAGDIMMTTSFDHNVNVRHQTPNLREQYRNIFKYTFLLQFRRFALLQMTWLWWLDHHGFYLLVTFKFIQAFHILQGAACGWKCWWQSFNMLKCFVCSPKICLYFVSGR